ncbi:oxidoreductase [Mycena albidolilacea]|uniref:Oxidoreductase n=1 Tax=Mycena albidolilacea TaxID=1033008 RepID=A0AAD6ZXK4_9AGAR|nr:oxidoreductase [Mycena albidolilacea]
MVRAILVTGANQGLGMHTVHQLAATPGVLVFMGSRKITAAEEAAEKFAADVHSSSTVVLVQLDITDEASIKAAHASVAQVLKQKEISGLDVLVNNAASALGSFEEVFKTIVFGTVAVTDAFRPLLSNGAVILNISSGLGSMGLYAHPGIPILPAYASSKAALNMLTVLWAKQEEEKQSGIRVLSICPGSNATQMNNYSAGGSPAEGCKIIVKAALETEGRTGVFIHKDGDYPW